MWARGGHETNALRVPLSVWPETSGPLRDTILWRAVAHPGPTISGPFRVRDSWGYRPTRSSAGCCAETI